jgi:hypothetical protein
LFSEATAVMVLADLQPAAWAWWRLVRGPGALKAAPGAQFAKVLGSGHEGGFGLRPSTSRQGLFCLFASGEQAKQFLRSAPLMSAYRQHARELCSVLLRAYSCKGAWDGGALPLSAAAPQNGLVAALTRASIRPGKALEFWRLAPAAQRDLESAQGCRLSAGLGEAPFLRQATFTLWDSVDAMSAYARQGAHQRAIEASARGGYFSESMFARFVPAEIEGRWMGKAIG